MEIKLNKIKLENFKGIKSFEFSPDGQDALIRAENGMGKTTICDGWLWSLFGKDSDGRADFNIRPLDALNEPIKGLLVAVEMELEINGEVHTLRKEQHEKIVKGQIKGFEARCFIDEVPTKVGEYQEYITNLCPEEMFKMLTDLSYFNGKMHWSARRKVLLDIAGKIPKPVGFENLLKNLNGRKLEDYQKILSDRKKSYDTERKEINPRIDEKQLGLDDYVQDTDTGKLQDQRGKINNVIDTLSEQRNKLLCSEKQRQKTIEQINKLTVQRLHRESIVKNQSGPMDELLAERAELERRHADKTQELVGIQNLIRQASSAIESAQNQIAQSLLTLTSIKDEYKSIDKPNCPTCGQLWPEGKPKPGQKDIVERGNKVKAAIDNCKTQKAELQDELNKLIADEKAKVEELKSAESVKNKRIAEINEAIKNRPQADPKTDSEWNKLTTEIEKLQSELGGPVSEQLEVIETNIKAAQEKLNGINETLAQADNIKKAKARIIELESREKELAQLITDCEKELDQIQQYNMQVSRMVEAAVNGRFKYVTFKLFEYFLNGEINDKVCEAVYQGVPYPDMSSGQKIFCGIDIVNTLSDHYGISAPLFVDHSESMTMPIQAESQTIQLFAVKGVKKLQVEVQKKEKAKVA